MQIGRTIGDTLKSSMDDTKKISSAKVKNNLSSNKVKKEEPAEWNLKTIIRLMPPTRIVREYFRARVIDINKDDELDD